MRDRLKEYMDGLNLNARQFADLIGVQASSVSHILTGRNKPSVDFLLKLLESFPDIDIKYLLTGESSVEKVVDNREFQAPVSGGIEAINPECKQPDSSDTNVKTPSDITDVIVLKSDGTFSRYKAEN